MTRYYTLTYQSINYLAKIETSNDGYSEFYCKHTNDTESLIYQLYSPDNPSATMVSTFSRSYNSLKSIKSLYQVSFYFISIHFPWIKWITYKDNSVIHHETQPIAFANFHFLIHGKTWFEKWFHATPYEYRKYKAYQRHHMSQKPEPFFYLWNGGILDTHLEYKSIHDIYNACTSQQAFFKRLYEVYGYTPFIELSRSDYLLSIKSLYRTQWYIDLHKLAFVPGISVKIIEDSAFTSKWNPCKETNLVWVGEERFIKDFGSIDDLLEDD